jgi:hypothetical protein
VSADVTATELARLRSEGFRAVLAGQSSYAVTQQPVEPGSELAGELIGMAIGTIVLMPAVMAVGAGLDLAGHPVWGARAEVAARLIDTTSGEVLWSGTATGASHDSVRRAGWAIKDAMSAAADALAAQARGAAPPA